jgi:hypothetical protein
MALLKHGHAAAATRRMDLAATACAMFIEEYGAGHEHTGLAATRLVHYLAPLDLKHVAIKRAEGGPVFRPQWIDGQERSPGRLRQAVAAGAFLADLLQDAKSKGAVLVRVGWLHRALNDWDASAAAWDRCAKEAAGTPAASEALWLAAQNLGWTNRPVEAADRLTAFIRDYPKDRRIRNAHVYLAAYRAEARRLERWGDDPVASLRSEIEERAESRQAHQVYGSVANWLKRKHDYAALIAVSRWACTQGYWPARSKFMAHIELTDALLAQPGAGEAARREAADVMRAACDLSPNDGWATSCGIRRARLLRGLGDFEAADETLCRLADRVKGLAGREPDVLGERIRLMLERGDQKAARALFDELEKSYPEYAESTDLGKAFDETSGEDK